MWKVMIESIKNGTPVRLESGRKSRGTTGLSRGDIAIIANQANQVKRKARMEETKLRIYDIVKSGTHNSNVIAAKIGKVNTHIRTLMNAMLEDGRLKRTRSSAGLGGNSPYIWEINDQERKSK